MVNTVLRKVFIIFAMVSNLAHLTEKPSAGGELAKS